MKCYLINLDRAPERLARMQQLFDKQGIEFERVSAVDAKSQTYNLASADSKTPSGQPALVAGDIACGASHRICLQRIASGDDRYGVILEDDLHLADDFSFFLNSDRWLPAEADLVKLETFDQITFLTAPVIMLPNQRSLSRLVGSHLGAAAYVVSKSAAKRILEEFDNEIEYIDIFLFQTQLPKYKVFQVSPAPAIQDVLRQLPGTPYLESDINPHRHPLTFDKFKGWSKFRREILRPWRRFRLFVVICWFRAAREKHYGKVPFRL